MRKDISVWLFVSLEIESLGKSIKAKSKRKPGLDYYDNVREKDFPYQGKFGKFANNDDDNNG